jgi:hypothetical protein
MNITFSRNYVKKETGNDVFVYIVNGTPEEMESFKTAQGSNYRVDAKTGDILWFNSRYVGEAGKLIITSNNKVVADTSAFAKAKSLSAQYGGNFGQELARAAAANLISGLTKTTASATVSSAPAADLGDL